MKKCVELILALLLICLPALAAESAPVELPDGARDLLRLFAGATDEALPFDGSAGDGNLTVEVALSSVAADGDAVMVELSSYQAEEGGYPQNFIGNARARLEVDSEARFGARIVAWEMLEPPVFDAATATAQLRDMDGNNYDAANAIDGKPETCWAYPASGSGAALTLTASAPQTVRGLEVTPGYAKSAYAFEGNLRVKQLTVTLSGGEEFIFDLADVGKDDFDGRYVLAFDGAYTADAVTLEVTDTYAGARFDDVCISEVLMF